MADVGTGSVTVPDIRAEMKQGCESIWNITLTRCKETLGTDDYEEVSSYESPEQLFAALEAIQRKYSDSSLLRLIRRVLPVIVHLRVFAMTLLLALGPRKISLACIWGGISLLIELASKSEKALAEIALMFEELGHSFVLFKIYSAPAELDTDLFESLFDILVEIVLLSALTIKHFRRNDARTITTTVAWASLREKYTLVSKNLATRVRHVKERVEADNIATIHLQQAKLNQRLDGYVLSGMQRAENDHVKLPCHAIPFPQNPGFYGRTDILSSIQQSLQIKDSAVASLGLWGTGGIGKSQIALQYAHQKVNDGLPIIIWVPSETKEEVSAAFVNASLALDLPGISEARTPEQNRRLVVEWLRKTSHQWLLVFDNVENEEVLKQSWPVSGNGSILVTCRSELMAVSYTATVLEVPVFSTEEGSEIILEMLSREVSVEERNSSLKLSKKLGGLALALDLISKQIRSRRTTVTQFLQYYDRSHRSFHKTPKRGLRNTYYSKDLETVWATSFERLTQNASRLMSLLCFFAPEAIPFDILQNCDAQLSSFEFVKSLEELDEIKLELSDLALINVNPLNSLVSIHRLVQTAYFDRLSQSNSVACLRASLCILRAAFPRQDDGNHLRPHWSTCEKLIQHVQASARRYEELHNNDYPGDYESVTMLFSDAAWYLHEVGAHASSNQLLRTAMISCINKHSLAYSNLCTTSGTNDDQRGHGRNAVQHFMVALEIRRSLLPRGHEEITNALSNAALALLGTYRPDEALELLNEAIQVDCEKSWEHRSRSNADFRLRNLGRLYNMTGDYYKAEQCIQESRKYTTVNKGRDSYYEATHYHMLAQIAFNRGTLEESLRLETKALNLFLKTDPTHKFITSACYRIGLVRMSEGYLDDALENFRRALDIASLNEEQKGDKGESARILRKMASILHTQGHKDKSQELHTAAKKIYDECHATGLYTASRNGSIEDEDGWDNLIAFLYR